jgi:hypothetical protein
MDRRSFLRGLIAAPAIIAVDRLMPIKPLPILTAEWSYLGETYAAVQSAFPIIKGDGVHDDGPGLRAFFDGLDFIDEVGGFRTEVDANGRETKHLANGMFFVNGPLSFPPFPTRTMGAASSRSVKGCSSIWLECRSPKPEV